jgi:Flp pilus assembly protein TadD, contains TPR repeats
LLDLEKNLLDALSLFIISYVFYSVKRIDKAKEYLSDSKSAGIAPRFENYLMGLIYLEDRDSNQNEALSCFNIATNSDPNFSDAYNGIAVVLAQKGQLSEALDAVRTSLAIDPSNVTANENLTKLIINKEEKNQINFWDFWNSSGWKRGTAVFLSILAIGLVFYGIFLTEIPLPPTTTTLTNETTVNGTVKSTIITNSTNFTKGQSTNKVLQDLPNSYLILVGLIVVIILIPQIKSAKIGEIEIEMITPETPTTDTTLRLSYTLLQQIEEQLARQADNLR